MSLLFSILSFLLPTQLGLHLDTIQSTVYGFRIDYLISTIYLTDILAILIIVLGFRYVKITKRFVLFSVLYFALALLNISISNYFVPSVYKWLKITELILLGIVIINCKKFDIFKNFLKPLSYSMIIACILGIWQFFNKSSIGALFYWLGERSFLFSDPNISPYPYSTFSHPNSFAGFLLVFGILIIQFKNKFNKKYFWVLACLIFVNLILTNSLNTYIAIGLLLFVRYKSNLTFSFLSFDFSQRFISHRFELINASWQMIKENWIIGVGLNNFIPNLPKVTNTFLNAWELQPVHNIFLLVFSETGVIGIVSFCFLLFSSFSLYPIPYSLIAIVATGLSDHYWLTLQQNMLLFTYILAINFKWKKKD